MHMEAWESPMAASDRKIMNVIWGCVTLALVAQAVAGVKFLESLGWLRF